MPDAGQGRAALGLLQILNEWGIFPAFVTLKITLPTGIPLLFESLKANSVGFRP